MAVLREEPYESEVRGEFCSFCFGRAHLVNYLRVNSHSTGKALSLSNGFESRFRHLGIIQSPQASMKWGQ